MISEHIASQIYANFRFVPTPGQKKVIESLSEFLSDDDFSTVFILNGYAGTGKTTLIGALVAALKSLKISPVVLAPTGRAAKVASRYAGEPAYTIHKKIYRQKSLASSEASFSLDYNRHADAVFIVDEASMIPDHGNETSLFGTGNLLDDLVSYVRSGKRCRLILVGDDAQLPPVGEAASPALEPRRMGVYGGVVYASLDDVVRQQADSGILFNATLVRMMLANKIHQPPKFDLSFKDMRSITGGEFIEKVEECYSKYGKDETIVITRSNRSANRFNEGIRRHVLCAEGEIDSGDMLMVVKNNYHYTEKEQMGLDFIANGDIARLRRIRRFEELYGFRFAEATLVFGDYGDMELECRVMLDTLRSESPSLTREQSGTLFNGIAEDYADLRSKAKRMQAIREDPYYNAVQIKFAYAVTCHKAQGGQWGAVFIDRMLFGEEEMGRDLLRWLYTAITRATGVVYLVNFDSRFTGEEP